jgi:hypothetical protein
MGDTASPQEVERALTVLMQRDPDVARGIVREQLGRVADETVAGVNTRGLPDPDGGAKFAAALRGNRRTAENTAAAIEGAAGAPILEDIDRLEHFRPTRTRSLS